MITDLTSSLVHAHRRGAHLLVILGLTSLASLAAARAAAPGLSGVDPGDTFSIEAYGFSQADPSAAVPLMDTNLDPAFGTAYAYYEAASGQNVTVSSNESTSGGTTTDEIFVSVPNNFVPPDLTDKDGNVIDAVDFSIGGEQGGTDTLDLSAPVTGAVTTGSVAFMQAGAVVSLPVAMQSPMLSNGDKSFSDLETVTSYTAGYPITNSDILGFSVVVTYTSVPEPSTVVMMLLGGAGLVWLALRRRQVGA